MKVIEAIALNGIQGSGKSTLAREVVRQLGILLGEAGAQCLDITNLKMPSQKPFLKKAKASTDSWDVHIEYANSLCPAYVEEWGVVHVACMGIVPVLDGSELAAFAYARRFPGRDRVMGEMFVSGGMTGGYVASDQVIVRTSPECAWERLQARPNKGQYDPQSPREVEDEQKHYELAWEEYSKYLPLNINVIEVQNEDVSLSLLAQGIIKQSSFVR
jgi:hypothetical protein